MPLLAMCVSLHAQKEQVKPDAAAASMQLSKNEKMVSGKITDAATGKAIGGARISYGAAYAAISDAAGNFSMKVPDYNVAIRVDAEGFQGKEIALKGQRAVKASLYESSFSSVYDDVVTPTGILPKSHLTAAVASVQADGSWANTPETPDAFLQGKVAGLNIVRRSGTPNMGANMVLRGLSSLYADNRPLIIVDGVLFDNAGSGSLTNGFYNNPLSFIDIHDIDNISVIKDASSLYGAKGANGAILITTAHAKQQATKIDVGLYGSASLAPAQIPVMNRADYRTYLSELLQSKGLSYSEMQALPYLNDDLANPDYYRYHADNNWQQKIFRKGVSKNGYLRVTGGDNIAKYALSIGFLSNDGSLANTNLTRYNMRFNADLNLSKRLTASTNLSFLQNDQDLKELGLSPKTSPIYSALVKAPFLPTNEVDNNGVASPSLAAKDTFNVSNPMALVRNMQAMNRSYRFMGSVTFNYALQQNLSLSSTVAITHDKVRESYFVPEKGVVSDTLSTAIAKNRSAAGPTRLFSVYNDTRLAFNKTFNNIHQVSARLGIRYTRSKSEVDTTHGFNSATDQYTSVGYGLAALRQIGGSIGEYAWSNTYFAADYGLRGKYFVSLNVAADASSRFGTEASGLKISGNPIALFPSVSGSWLISSENFMASSHLFDLLKLRASFSQAGNDDIGDFAARNYYSSQNLLGVSGLVRGNIGNPSLKWETVTRINGGLDAALLKERLNVSVDVYQNRTRNMLVLEPAYTVTGFSSVATNSGALKTNGWEAAVNGRIINQKNLKWDAGFTLAHYDTKVTQLPSGPIYTNFADGTQITQVGSAPNLFYGYRTNGVYTTDAEAAAAGLSVKNANGTSSAFTGGDMRFVNTNASDNLIDDNDRQVIGNPNPDFFGSLTSRVVYKNWSLDVLASFSQGNDIYNYGRRQLESMSGYANQTEAVKNRWHTNGQVTNMPKATWGDPMGNSRFSDRWIEDGSYLRIKTVSVAYNVPLRPGFVKYATVYLTGNNVLTLTKYLGYDPEFSATSGIYGQGVDVLLEPQYRSGQIGVKLGL